MLTKELIKTLTDEVIITLYKNRKRTNEEILQNVDRSFQHSLILEEELLEDEIEKRKILAS